MSAQDGDSVEVLLGSSRGGAERAMVPGREAFESAITERLSFLRADQATELEAIVGDVTRLADSWRNAAVRLALQASEEWRELAERATGVGVVERDLVTDHTLWSSEIYRLHGIAPGTAPAHETWLSTIHPEDRERIQAGVEALCEGPHGSSGSAPKELTEDEYRVALPDGTLRWIALRLRVVFGADRGPTRLLAVTFDITDRKRAEASLQRSEEQLRLATGALAGFLYDWDPATNHLEWFGGTGEIFGFRLEEVRAEVGWYEGRIHPDDRSGCWEGVRLAFQNGAPGYSNVYRFLHRDGRYVSVADRSRIVRDETGRPIRVLGGVSDISERLRLERERAVLFDRERTARAVAEEATHARDDLLAVVSHDLQSSISVMAICGTALSETLTSASEGVREIIGVLQRSVEWMHRLVRNLVDASSIEAGFLSLERQTADPLRLLDQVRDLYAAGARESGIALEVRAPANLSAVRADPERLVQALANLVTNAVHYTERGGRVTLCAERDPAGIRFAVEDTGVGIAAEDLPHIFDRFWWKHRLRGQRGTGLGLAIARGIVEAHGARLDVQSERGQGSRFSFVISTAD
jgi:PAS domain S-box-containing protein